MVSFKLGLGGGVALLGLGAIILFRDQIGSFFKSISGGVETAENVSGVTNILSENLLGTLTGIQDSLTGLNDQFGNLGGFFEQQNTNFFNFLNQLGNTFNPPPLEQPPDVPNTGLLTPEQRASCQCGTSIIQDIQGDVQEKCLACADPPPVFVNDDDEFIGAPSPCIEVPQIGGGSFNSCTGVFTPPFNQPPPPTPIIPNPPVIVDPTIDDTGFEVGGIGTGEGGVIGTINPISFSCSMTIGQIISAGLASTASEAVNLKFVNCEQNASGFDFGSNV